MASAEAAAHFHTRFQQGVQGAPAINEALRHASPDVTRATSELKALKGELSRALPTLPTYDQRSYDLKVRELQSRLSAVRPKDSKPRFAFGAKARQAAQNGVTTQESHAKEQQEQAPDVQQTADISQDVVVHNSGATTPSNLETYALSGRRGASLSLSDLPGTTKQSSSGLTVLLKDLEDCTVDLRPTAESSTRVTAIHAEGLKGTIVIAPIMDGACMLSRLEGCLIVLGAQQFRIHDSRDTTVLLQVPSVPIMEHSSGLRFGPYSLELGDPESRINRFAEVQDFDWVREGPSPNWSLLEPRSQATLSDLLQSTSAISADTDFRSTLLAALQTQVRD